MTRHACQSVGLRTSGASVVECGRTRIDSACRAAYPSVVRISEGVRSL